MSSPALPLIDSTAALDALTQASGTLLVTFTGPKCIICKRLAPLLEVVVREAGDALRSAKIDAEALPDVAERFRVRSLPTTVLMRGGRVLAERVGMASATELRAWLRESGVAM